MCEHNANPFSWVIKKFTIKWYHLGCGCAKSYSHHRRLDDRMQSLPLFHSPGCSLAYLVLNFFVYLKLIRKSKSRKKWKFSGFSSVWLLEFYLIYSLKSSSHENQACFILKATSVLESCSFGFAVLLIKKLICISNL